MRRTETPEPIWIKILHGGRYRRRSYLHKFWWPSVKGFWVAGGQISPSPIDFHRRPYNTLALPCERVMYCVCVPRWRLVPFSIYTAYSVLVVSSSLSQSSSNKLVSWTNRDDIGLRAAERVWLLKLNNEVYRWVNSSIIVFHGALLYYLRNGAR